MRREIGNTHWRSRVAGFGAKPDVGTRLRAIGRESREHGKPEITVWAAAVPRVGSNALCGFECSSLAMRSSRSRSFYAA